MIIHIALKIPYADRDDQYDVIFEQSIDPKNVEVAIERIEDLPNEVAKFVTESIASLDLVAKYAAEAQKTDTNYQKEKVDEGLIQKGVDEELRKQLIEKLVAESQPKEETGNGDNG